MSGRRRRRRLLSSGTQGPVDDFPNLLFGNGAVEALAIHKHRGCAIDLQHLGFLE